MVRFINEEQVKALLPLETAIACVEQAFRDRQSGQAVDVPRERTKTGGGTLHILQAGSTALGVIGFKAYFMGRATRTFVLHILELDSGRWLGLIECEELGIRRTGAATAVATRALSRPDAKVLACFGTGRHGMTQLRSVLAVRDIKEVRTFGRTQERLQRFKLEVERDLAIPVIIAGSAAEALRGADVVNIVTRSATPVFDGADLAPGQHINAVGSNALDRREVDLTTIRRADRIVVDSVEVAQRECGDLLPAAEAGIVNWHTLPDLGAVVSSDVAGRRSDQDITLFESQGMGMQDLYVGKFLLDEAIRMGIGTDLPIG